MKYKFSLVQKYVLLVGLCLIYSQSCSCLANTDADDINSVLNSFYAMNNGIISAKNVQDCLNIRKQYSDKETKQDIVLLEHTTKESEKSSNYWFAHLKKGAFDPSKCKVDVAYTYGSMPSDKAKIEYHCDTKNFTESYVMESGDWKIDNGL